jgi:hypothetical protein
MLHDCHGDDRKTHFHVCDLKRGDSGFEGLAAASAEVNRKYAGSARPNAAEAVAGKVAGGAPTAAWAGMRPVGSA